MVFSCSGKKPVKETVEKINVSGGPPGKSAQKSKN